MKIHLIWARTDSEPWLLDAWDEYSVDANDEGWMDAKAEALSAYGHDNVRVTTTVVDYEFKVLAAFQPADVTAVSA